MSKDKKILYGVSLSAFAVLLSIFLLNVEYHRILTACVLIPITVIMMVVMRKHRIPSIHKREVTLFVGIMAALYVFLIQMSGIFFKFYKNPYFINTKLLLDTVVPLTVMILCVEIIRYLLLSQQKTPLLGVIAFVICVLAEVLTLSTLSVITSLNQFMNLVGLTLFPAVNANILYHYVSKRYGAVPNVVFRLIITLSAYFIPTTTGMSESLSACFSLILPILVLSLLIALFEKKKKRAHHKGKKLSMVATALTVLLVISVAMLVSCQFRFGALVIATDSMTGEINQGDMVIYERYDGQKIEEGQVVVFQKDQNRIVHRVVKIETIDNEVRYYTKGDANEDLDFGYRTEADIVGLSDLKISYIGFPTLWLRDLLPGT